VLSIGCYYFTGRDGTGAGHPAYYFTGRDGTRRDDAYAARRQTVRSAVVLTLPFEGLSPSSSEGKGKYQVMTENVEKQGMRCSW
jgi:hypothetical protein